jgi:hypothetical protein
MLWFGIELKARMKELHNLSPSCIPNVFGYSVIDSAGR